MDTIGHWKHLYLNRSKPALNKDKINEMVNGGLQFYQERVLGPVSALASTKTTVVDGATEAITSEERADVTPMRPEDRPCVPEMREMFRLLGVHFTFDPDKKEGTLTFDPFAQHATG